MDLREEKGTCDRVFIFCSKTARKIISVASQTPEEEAYTLLMAASILRKAILNHDTPFSYDGSLLKDCEESSVPRCMKYFFRHYLAGRDSPCVRWPC